MCTEYWLTVLVKNVQEKRGRIAYITYRPDMASGNKPINLYEPRREKTNILVSELIRYRPGYTATEDG